jgi:hypothetical protein
MTGSECVGCTGGVGVTGTVTVAVALGDAVADALADGDGLIA